MWKELLLQCEKYPLDFLSHLSGGFPLLVGLFRYRHLTSASRFIIVYFAFCFLKDSFTLWLSLLKQNNLYVQNIEVLIETWLITAIGWQLFSSAKVRRLGIFSALLCSIIILVTYSGYKFSSAASSVFRLYSIAFCFLYFAKILDEGKIKSVLVHTFFWFASGLLLYSTGSFFTGLFSDYWYKDVSQIPSDIFDKYYTINQISFIMFALLSTLGLWVSKYDRDNLL